MNTTRSLTTVIMTLAALLIILLSFSLWLLVRDEFGADSGPVSTATTVAEVVEATATTALAATATTMVDLPAAPVLDFTAVPTRTPMPATNTPEATATPLPTDTPVPPPPTNTAAPVVIVPTNTPVPPTATAVPVDTRGLNLTYFGIQDRSSLTVNGRIWFEFGLTNSAGGNVPYARLGVLPRKDGVDRFDWFQQSYGGPNATIKPSGLNHEDNIQLPEAGNYTLRLAICFGDFNACNSGGGTWVTLSPEIPVTIN